MPSPAPREADTFEKHDVVHVNQASTHIYPTPALQLFAGSAVLCSPLIHLKIPWTESSSMIPIACIEKNRIAPLSLHDAPMAKSPITCTRPEKKKTRVRRTYLERKVPFCSRSTEKHMKFAGADNFWRSAWCQYELLDCQKKRPAKQKKRKKNGWSSPPKLAQRP